MNTRQSKFSPPSALRPLALALQLAALAVTGVGFALGSGAQAAEATVEELTKPGSTVEVGVVTNNEASAKANEYSGVKGKGSFAAVNFDLRRNGAYDSEDTTRLRLTGSNLGLDSSSLGLEYGQQGLFRLNLSVDQILRQRSDSYQTPYLGAGTNQLTLPSNWLAPLVPALNNVLPAQGANNGANARGLSPDVTGSDVIVKGKRLSPTADQLAQAAQIQAADLPAFQNLALSTKRTAYGIGFTLLLSPRWQASASVRQEDKTGLKPMGTVTRYTNGDLAAVIPDRIDQTTEQINLELAYLGERLNLSASYYGSLFSNHVDSMTWANWAVPGNLQTMSSAPSNQFHQLNLNGSYALSSATRLSGQFSYGRGTQDQTYLTNAGTPVVPVSSLHGLVVSQSAHLKLVSRASRDWTLAAAYKFDDRDNRTPVNTYAFYDAGEAASGVSPFASYFPGANLGANATINANRAYSKKVNQINLDADYRLAPGQALKLAGEAQRIDRHCDGSWIACADADRSNETTLRGEWRFQALESLDGRLGLSAAHRTVNYNEDAFLALVPMANVSPTGAPNGATAYGTMLALGYTGYGPVSGLNPLPPAGSAQAFFFANNNALSNSLYGNANRISELPGMRRYNMADRNRNKLRGALNWQASETMSLQASLDVNGDRYGHSVYGLTSARNHALNLDGTYAPSDTLSISLFATAEDQRSKSAGNSYTANSSTTNVGGFTLISGGCYATIGDRNANNKIDPCLNWAADMHDRVNTLGLHLDEKSLWAGRLDLSGDLSLSRARSDTHITGGNYVNNPLAVAGAAADTVAAYYIPASDLPSVTTNNTEVRLNARYLLSKDQRLGLGYLWQHMRAVDWVYDGMQYGGLSGVLPTNETAPKYTVQTLVFSFQQSFR